MSTDACRAVHAALRTAGELECPIIKAEPDADLSLEGSGMDVDLNHPLSKQCTRCKTLQPETSFFRDSSKTTGLTSWCKCCFSEYCSERDVHSSGAGSAGVGSASAAGATGLRSCRLCHLSKPASDFVRDSRRNTGLDARCKVCRREQHRVRKEVRVAGRPAVTEKACRRCGSTKPASAFKKHAYTSSGLDSWCKACCSERRREKVKPRVYAPTVGHKACIRCGKDKAAVEFTRDTGKRTGLGARCKACENEYRKEKRTSKRSQGPAAVHCGGAEGTQSASSAMAEAAAGASGSDDAEATCSPNLAADVAVGHSVELPWRDGSMLMCSSHFCDDAGEGGMSDLPASSARWPAQVPRPESPPRPPRRPRSTRIAAAAGQIGAGASISKIAWLSEAQERLPLLGAQAASRTGDSLGTSHAAQHAGGAQPGMLRDAFPEPGYLVPAGHWSSVAAPCHSIALPGASTTAEPVAPHTLYACTSTTCRPPYVSDSEFEEDGFPMHGSSGVPPVVSSLCSRGDRGWDSLPSLESFLQLGGLDGSDDEDLVLPDFDLGGLSYSMTVAMGVPDLGPLVDADYIQLGDVSVGPHTRGPASGDPSAGARPRPLSPIGFDVFAAAHDMFSSPTPPQPPAPHNAMLLPML